MEIIHNFDESPKEDCSGNNNCDSGTDALFGLTDECDELNHMKHYDEQSGQIDNFLQKIHLRNHEITANETFHKFSGEEAEDESELLSEEDECLFSNVQQAIAEKDIIDLRANLQSISQNISIHQWNSEDIERYLSKDLDMLKQGLILYEAQSDRNLAEDINLFREIDEAIGEKDIMQLRSSLKSIIKFESSHSQSINKIEGIDNSSLEQAIQQRQGILPLRLRNSIWYAAAASVIFLVAFSVIISSHSYSVPELYAKFYQPVKTDLGTTRSASMSDESILNLALSQMRIGEYDTALKLFTDVLTQDNQNVVGNFYSGAIHQEKGQYSEAIKSFTKVVAQGDNLFIEQSEWYLGLCYLGLNQRDNAIRQFRKISACDGYYRQESKKLLERLGD
jgi:tetratricopeptide (TPR) repeat protein